MPRYLVARDLSQRSIARRQKVDIMPNYYGEFPKRSDLVRTENLQGQRREASADDSDYLFYYGFCQHSSKELKAPIVGSKMHVR